MQAEEKYIRKFRYAVEAFGGPDPFPPPPALDVDIKAAIDWQAGRSVQDRMKEREAMVKSLEDASWAMHQSGARDKWFEGCDADIARVSQEVSSQLRCFVFKTFVPRKYRR